MSMQGKTQLDPAAFAKIKTDMETGVRERLVNSVEKLTDQEFVWALDIFRKSPPQVPGSDMEMTYQLLEARAKKEGK